MDWLSSKKSSELSSPPKVFLKQETLMAARFCKSRSSSLPSSLTLPSLDIAQVLFYSKMLAFGIFFTEIKLPRQPIPLVSF